MKIYNLKGQTVRKIQMNPSASGFSAVWDGKDDNGVKQKTGIYFCKIKAADKVLYKKIGDVVR